MDNNVIVLGEHRNDHMRRRLFNDECTHASVPPHGEPVGPLPIRNQERVMTNDSLRGRPLDAADPSPRRVIAAVVVQALDKSQGHADADARSLADLTIDDLRAAPTAPADPEAQLASYVVEVLTPDLPAVLTALSAKAREGSATHQRLYLQLLGIVPMGSTYRPPTAPTNGADPDAEG